MNDRFHLTRRKLLSTAAAAVLVPPVIDRGVHSARAATRGRVKQSICFWCFNSAGEKWDVETTCRIAKDLGCVSVELVDPADWGTLKKNGLTCAIAMNGITTSPPFAHGYNNPRYHDEVIAGAKKMIDASADFGCPNIIAFTGYKWRDAENPKSGAIPPDEAAANCVKGLKHIAGYAEKKGITVCVE